MSSGDKGEDMKYVVEHLEELSGVTTADSRRYP